MAKEIEEYFIKRLQSYLLEYLQDFSQNNMAKFSLGISTNIVLKNLQLKKQALLNFKLPLYIINGKINQITLNMPLNYKKQQPEMIIEGIDLLVCSIQEANLFEQNKEHNQQGVENLKKHKLKLWEEQMAQHLEKLSPPNWIQKIVDGIYNNMSITVKQFSLRFFNNSLLGYETSLRIKFDIFIKATDKDFKYLFNHDINSIYKLIEVKKLGITFRGETNSSLKKKEDNFILTPIDIDMRLKINLIYEQLVQPMKSLEISIKSPLIFQLNKEQKLFFLKLNDFFQYQDVIQDNFHLRPIKEIKSNYSEWWKYMINAVMLKQKTAKLDLGYSSKKLVMMKRYIELYKRKQTIILVPWLSSWTMQDEVKFKKCEDYLSLKDLLKYREWAFQEIKIEAKRYYNSSKDGQNNQSVKPLLEIWTKTINNKNSFRDHSKRNDNIPIELEDDEKINLYEILERDKTNVLSSYLKGEYNHSDQVKLQFSLEIHSIIFLLLECRAQRFIKYTPENTRIFQFCQCRYHLKLLKKTSSAQRKKSRNSQHHNSFTQAYQDIQKSQNIEKSFHTAKEVDSFDDDIRDLQEDGSVISLTSNSVERQNDSEIKQNHELAFNQRLILIITLIGIKVPLLIYQNDGIRTPPQKLTKEGSKDIVIGDIRFISPGMIPKLIEESDSVISSQSPLFEKKKDPKKSENLSVQRFRKTVIKFNEFFNEIIEISITQDSQQFLNSELCYQLLGEFLKQNQMINIKCFLDDYERDKNGFQDFTQEQFKVYDKYFDDKPPEEDPLFLHLAKHQNNENKWELLKNAALQTSERDKQNLWTSFDNNSKHLFLQQSHNRIVEIIRKCLFVPFIEEYGEIILPICIQNLRDKLTFPVQRPSSIKEQEFNHLEICLNFQGQSSEYKILPNTEIKKQQKQSQDINKIQQDLLQITLNKQSLLLSTKSLSSLLCFFDEKKGLSQTQAYHNCLEDQKLLQCITKSKPLEKQIISQQKQNLQVKMDDKFKIKIVSDSLYNKIRTELKLQINKFLLQTVNLEELQKDKDIINYFRGLDDSSIRRQQRFYQIHKAIIYSFKIQHKYFSLDNRQLKDEQRINTEKSNPSARNIHVKDLPNSPGKVKINQQIKHSSSLWFQFDQDQKQKPSSQLSSSNNIKQQQSHGKFKGIKQVIVDTQIIFYKLDSTIQNHPLLTDSKLFIYIPHFYFKINDSFICFIEVLTILNKRLSKKQQENDFKYSMVKDSLIRAELLVLQNEHSNKQMDCKHCILKYRKSLSMTNIIFGEIPHQKTEINVFSLLAYEQQLIFIKQQGKMIEQAKASGHSEQTFKQKKFSGIRIKFFSTPKSIHNQKNTSIIALPFLIITRDFGYFKDTIAIHCTETINKNDELWRKNSIKEKEILKKVVLDRNRSLRDVQRQPQNIPNQQEIKEEQNEKNYIVFYPTLKVQEPARLWEKLDDKFLFYCRSEESNMFNADHEQKQMQQQAKVKQAYEMDSKEETAEKFNEKNHLYLLCYYHKPLRVPMLSNINEEYYLEKGSKTKFFLSIELIQAIFPNQFATYNIINIIKNISSIKNIVENAYNSINQDLLQKEEEKQVLKQNPMKLLDEIIVYALIKKIHIQSNETKFKLNQLRVFIQLSLMESYAPIMQKRTVQSYLGPKISGAHLQKNRSSIINYPEECQIIRCDTITFSFNQFSQIDIKIINVTKHKDELRLSVDDIQISIQSNLPRQRESLLQMPGKDNSTQRVKVALHINLLFQNYHPLVKIQIEQAKIFVSQQKIQDLLIAVNSFYLISIEESVSLKQYLQNYIFKQNLHLINSEERSVNLFMKQPKKNQKYLHFVIEIEIDSLIIKLQEKDMDFFVFQFHQIYLKKRLNTELELSIQRIELKPQPQSDELLQYPNLIEQIDNQTGVFKLENKVIYLENLKFYFIARYINELEAFKQRITEMLSKNQEELTQKYQKDFDMQLQIKQEEDFLKDKDQFFYTIHIKNCLLLIPELSTKSNLVMVDFSFAQISLQKAKIELRVPDIEDDEDQLQTIFDDKLIIDYKDKNQLESCLFYVIQLIGEFQDVQVNYIITGRQDKKQDVRTIGELLSAGSLTLNLDLPSFEQSCGLIPWKLKDQCKIKTHNLQMNLDFGKLIQVSGFLQSNNSEKSPLFNFSQSFLQKINYELFCDDGSLSFTSFTQAEPEKVSQLKEQAKVYKKQKPRKSKNFSYQSNTQSQGSSFV